MVGHDAVTTTPFPLFLANVNTFSLFLPISSLPTVYSSSSSSSVFKINVLPWAALKKWKIVFVSLMLCFCLFS